MTTANALVKLEGATRALAEAKTLGDVKHIVDIAEAARVYARAAKLGEEAQNHAAEVAIRAKRKAGEILAGMNKGKGGRPQETPASVAAVSDYRKALDESAVADRTARQWQEIAAIPEPAFEATVAEVAAGGELTTSGVLAKAKGEPIAQGTREILDAAKSIRSRTAASRAEARRGMRPAALPDGQFRVIYADPPWSYGNTLPEDYGEVSKHYGSLTIAELCALPIASMAADNAVLFMWVTSPLLEECFAVIRAWGFAYKASFVWDKVRHNYGHYNSVRHEFLLVCTRGSCTPDTRQLVDSVVECERTDRHSEKPETFRRIIDTLYPDGPRVELFARTRTPGWEVFGNECD